MFNLSQTKRRNGGDIHQWQHLMGSWFFDIEIDLVCKLGTKIILCTNRGTIVGVEGFKLLLGIMTKARELMVCILNVMSQNEKHPIGLG